jgi:uncharacterized protein (TIGR02001 family)
MNASSAGLAIALLCGDAGLSGASAKSAFSGSLTLTSDYRFRGVSQNAGQIAPQGELDWSGVHGWSAGAFLSKVDFQDHEDTSLELDVFGGKHFDLDDDTGLDLTAYYYGYPDHHPRTGSPRYSTFEANLKLSRQWGAATLNAGASWSPNFLGNGEAWDLETGVSYGATFWLSLVGHLGCQWERRWNGLAESGFPYVYGDIGLTATHKTWTLDLRYATTTLSRAECALTEGGRNWCEGGFILTLSYGIGSRT